MWFGSWTREGLEFQFGEDADGNNTHIDAIPVEYEITDPDDVIALPEGRNYDMEG